MAEPNRNANPDNMAEGINAMYGRMDAGQVMMTREERTELLGLLNRTQRREALSDDEQLRRDTLTLQLLVDQESTMTSTRDRLRIYISILP